jgi:outer membrane protein OmpA-like peptidoglycan-associated protein
MRKIALALATASTIIASPALAGDGQSYIGVEAGAVFPGDIEVVDRTTGDETIIETGNNWNLDADVLVGHDFGKFRLEAEVGYKEFGLESFIPAGTSVSTAIDDGNVTVLSSMINALVDIGGNDGVGFSFGGGLGIAGVDAEVDSPALVHDEDIALAWQGIAALRVPVSDNVDLGLKYRYFNVEGIKMNDSFGDAMKTDLTSHSVLGSLIFNFGGAQAAPPPPVARCNQGPYIVFFDWDKSDITPEAATILNNAVTAYGNCGTAAIMLAGHTDRSGSNQYNQGLAERRNASVRTYLTGRGIPQARISSQAFGESMPRVPTADGVRELQNRRVEISYGPGSGS